ncbi:condensation domain-containing protein [Streptosporangium soli]|nr:hypothetical protein [Streptosporangium sp. KLBMP 9127]
MTGDADERLTAFEADRTFDGTARVLSAVQLAILSAQATAGDPSAYTLLSSVRAHGIPSWAALLDAARATLARHDVFAWRLDLDSAFEIDVRAEPGSGVPPFVIEQVDVSSLSSPEADLAVAERLSAERHRVVNLFDSDTPYTRLIVFRLPPVAPAGGHEAVCTLVTHHVLLDEHATDLLWSELFRRIAQRAVPERHDRRYARWAAGSLAPHAQEAARQAAQEIVRQLRAAGLGTLPATAGPPAASAPPLRFALPESLSTAAAAQAAALAVPVAAVYGTALSETLAARARPPRLALHIPMTRRTTAADADVVGCYVAFVPVLAQAPDPALTPRQAIGRWQRSVTFAAARAHASLADCDTALGGPAQAVLSFENRHAHRRIGPVRWTPLPPPDSAAKSDVTVFLAPAAAGHAGDGRIVWRAGAGDAAAAGRLVTDFLARAQALSEPA